MCYIARGVNLIWHLVHVYRPVRNFSYFDLQVWFVILDKQLYWGLVHTTPEKFENAALFLWVGLPSTIIRHENGHSSNENTVQTPGIWNRRPCVLMWTENIFKMELFQNDDVTISLNTNPRWPVIVAFSNFSNEVWTENIGYVFRVINSLFKFLRRSMDGEHLMHFQSETSVSKFLRHSVDSVLAQSRGGAENSWNFCIETCYCAFFLVQCLPKRIGYLNWVQLT